MRLSVESERQFILLYGRRSDKELSQYFEVTLSDVEGIARALSLGKDKRVFRGMGMPRWHADEVALLRQLYPIMSNKDVAHHMGRSVKSVISKAHHLGLKKESEYLSQMGRDNVRYRKDRSQLKLL